MKLSDPPVISFAAPPVSVTATVCAPVAGFSRPNTSRNPDVELLVCTVFSNGTVTPLYVTVAAWPPSPFFPTATPTSSAFPATVCDHDRAVQFPHLAPALDGPVRRRRPPPHGPREGQR